MSGSSLERLENRIRSAVQEAKAMRDENARMQAHLDELVAERDTWRQKACQAAGDGNDIAVAVDHRTVRERLRVLLKRLDRIERCLKDQENQ